MKLLFLLALVFPIAVATADIEKDLGLQKIHDRTPDLKFSDDSGHMHQLSEYKGKVVILHLWASWCTSCRIELPQMAAFLDGLKDPKLVLLPVSVDKAEDQSKAADLIRGIHPSLPLYLAEPKPDTKRYWSWGLPMTYFISSKGKVAARAMGPKDWSKVSKPAFHQFLLRLGGL